MSDTQSATIGCYSTIKNQLFCTCKLPKSPSSAKKEVHEVEVDHSNHLNLKEEKVVSVPPGIVARLMGLESMPESNWVPKGNYRSRSVSSITYWSEFDPVHHRIRTSVSLQETPTYLQVTDNDFLLSKSEIVCLKKQPRTKEGRHDMRPREVKQREVERKKPTRNPREDVQKFSRNTRQIVVQKKEKQDKTLGSAQNAASAVASPKKNNSKKPIDASTGKITNSVRGRYRDRPRDKTRFPLKKEDRAEFQLGHLVVAPKAHSSAKEKRKQSCSKLRRNRQLDILDSKFSSRRHVIGNPNSVTLKTQSKSTKSVWYLKAKGLAYKLADEELKRFISKQREISKMEGIEEIGTEFGLRILEGLVHEVVVEISGLPLQNLGLLLMKDVSNSHNVCI